jgi:hypothetical protein
MHHIPDNAVKLIKRLTENACTTGQKNYALAQQRAAQFSSQFSEPASIMRESLSKYHVNDFSDKKIIL